MRLTMNFLRCVIIILARTGPREALTLTQSNCSWILLLNINTDFWHVPRINFFNKAWIILYLKVSHCKSVSELYQLFSSEVHL